MRADPLSLVLNEGLEINKNFIMISGNEETLMQKIKDILVKNYTIRGDFIKEEIDNINSNNNEVSLFNRRKLYVLHKSSGVNDDELTKLSESEDKFVFFLENSPKNKTIKNIFLKRKDSCVFDCYELSVESKTKILKNWLDKLDLKINESLFWEIVERLDNRYLFFEKELEKLKTLKKEKLNSDIVRKIISINSSDSEKLFFEIFNKNEKLINLYNQRITNQSEVYSFYFFFRQYCFLIINNANEEEFIKNIPKYLFRERGFLINLYKKYSVVKKIKLLKLLYNTEVLLRKNHILSISIGLRFLLSFKKITIS